jgi:formylglycine-generating enzyme required for sulfatase activity
MKKIILFLLIFISFSFSSHRKKKRIPPGTVQITETFFVDECEVSNFSWLEYVLWTKNFYGADSPEYLAALPDTSVWLKDNNEMYYSLYFWHPAFRDYPVVGISYEQALEFCKWRTERVKQFIHLGCKKDWEIEYRLPTKKEWESLHVTLQNIERLQKEKVSFNLKDTTSLKNAHHDNADVTAPVFSYKPNSFKIYNLIGNVAEMVEEKNICKGGSWKHFPSEAYPGKDISYEKPEAWLGFRCVCIVK